MPRLPQVSGRELVKLLHSLGYETLRQRGSHVRLRKISGLGAHNLTVPDHSVLAKGTLHDILTQVSLWNSIPKDELLKRLGQNHSRDGPSRNARSLREREGWRSLRSALASIWRMRSRVTAKDWPTSSSVCSLPSSSPKRILMTFSSRGVRVRRTCPVWSFKLTLITASAGETTPRSSMKSPRCESSSSPIGVSSEIGSCAILSTLRTLATGISMRLAISSDVGSRPSSCTSCREVRMSLLMVSIMCTGMRMVRAWSAMARVMACRIHHVAYVENL